ncbi:MAG TPA: phosphotransferase [Nocardioidaceae bacterium]|nr:phosphotransferase [Nocardioidaceae bacterium]
MTPITTPIPAALDRLDAEWFTTALGSTAKVVAVTAEPLEVAGAAGELARVHLTYAETEGPSSVIAKFRGSSETQAAMDAALGIFDRERGFYRDVAPSVPVATPRCYFAGDGTEEPMLLEDLRHLRMGDQIAGCDDADAERVVDVLAKLHAASWDRPIPGGDGWALSLRDPMFAGMLTQLIASGVSALADRYTDRVPQRVLDALLETAPNWGEVLAACDEGPRTLVHNDCRLDNLFFRQDGEPVFIDWQIVAHTRGTQDIAYFLSGNFRPEVLGSRWEGLLRRYHDRLQEYGVGAYGWDECRRHYRQNVLYALAPGVAMLGAMAIGGDERGLADALVLRTLKHADELDSFATL